MSGWHEWTLTDGKATGRISLALTWTIKPAYYKDVNDFNDNGVCLQIEYGQGPELKSRGQSILAYWNNQCCKDFKKGFDIHSAYSVLAQV